MTQNLNTILLVSMTLMLASPAHAGIFKWVDANGITHYSDEASKIHQTQTLNIGGTNSAQTSEALQQYQKKKVFYDLELIGEKMPKTSERHLAASEVIPETMPEAMPDLDADEYDLSGSTPRMSQQPVSNIRNKLCTDSRMKQAALLEEGHAGYFDDAGNYRLAWGADAAYQGKRLYLTDEQIITLSKETSLEVEHYCDNPYDLELQEEARANWIRSEYCTVSRAFLEELEHPTKRTSDAEISAQKEEVERFCAKLEPGKHRNDDRYYPTALRSKNIIHKQPKFSIKWH